MPHGRMASVAGRTQLRAILSGSFLVVAYSNRTLYSAESLFCPIGLPHVGIHRGSVQMAALGRHWAHRAGQSSGLDTAGEVELQAQRDSGSPVRQPDLDGGRAPDVSDSMRWIPLIAYLQVAFDMFTGEPVPPATAITLETWRSRHGMGSPPVAWTSPH